MGDNEENQNGNFHESAIGERISSVNRARSEMGDNEKKNHSGDDHESIKGRWVSSIDGTLSELCDSEKNHAVDNRKSTLSERPSPLKRELSKTGDDEEKANGYVHNGASESSSLLNGDELIGQLQH